MTGRAKTKAQLLQEIDLLRARLQEAEDALEAIRSGEVDALVVSSSAGDQIFTLQGAEHPYRVMVETMNEGAATLLQDGSILYANPRLAAVLDEPVESLIGASILVFISPADLKIFEGSVAQGFSSSCQAEIHFRRRNLSTVPVFISFSPTQVEGGRALCLVVTDLSEQKRSEEIVADERLTRSILDQAADAILVCDTDGKIIRANQQALQTLPERPIYKYFEETLPLVHKNPVGKVFSIANVLAGESFQGIEAEYLSNQGENRFVLLSAAPLVKGPGQIIGCVVTLTELTDRKRAEEALRESEKKFRTLVESNMIGIVFTDNETGKTFDANDEYLRIIGRSRAELEAGQINWKMITPPEVLEIELQARLSRPPRANPQPYEKEYLRPDGTRVPVIIGYAFLDDRYPTDVAFVLDITGRKQMEENLAFQARLLESVHDAIIATDEHLIVTAWNKAAEEQYGWKAEEAIGRPMGELIQTELTDLQKQEALQELNESGHYHLEAIQYALHEKRMSIEGDSIALKDGSGRITGYVGSYRDITERKRAEDVIRSYATQLVQSNKDLLEFAYIASHDLQEPLRKIEAFGDLLGKSSQLEDVDRDYLERMQDAARRMRKMIDDLLELSRVATGRKPFKRVDLNQIAQRVVDDLEARIYQSQAQVLIDSLPTIDADAIQMQQLLQNLVGNAIKYRRPDVPPVVQVRFRESSAGSIEITVQDNGIGFEMKYVDQIFLPFRRLVGRSEYEGSGIGLAICWKIVERHGGRITAHSVPGQGSTFSVVLPIKQI